MKIRQILEYRDMCNVCGQTPCNCTHVMEDAEPMDREFALVKKLGRLGERIVQNPKLWDRYDQAIDTENTDWIVGLIQDGTGATADEVSKLADLFGEIGGGLGRIIDFAWAVKQGTWDKDFMNPYRAHRSQDMAEGMLGSLFGKKDDQYKPKGPDLVIYVKHADGTKTYANVKDAQHLADLQKKYRDEKPQVLDSSRQDVLDWLQSRGVNLRKFWPGAEITVGNRSLAEFARDDDGRDDGGEDPYKYPKPQHYERSIDFFGRFEADHFDDEEFDKNTGVFKGYWDDEQGRDQIAYFKFDNPQRTSDDDPGMGWYYEPQNESINEFAPPGDENSGEDDNLHQYAKMWYNGDDATKQQVEQILDRMGWEIGPLESEEGGCFVVRPGDENGDTYIGFTPEELAEGVAEGAGSIGNAIKSLYQKIYNAGDDEIEYFYNDSPIFAQYWDEYEGDIDSIIAEVDPGELQVILDELESYVQNANLAEAWTKLPSGDYINQHTGVRSSKPPAKKKRGEKTGAEWDAIEKAKKDKDQGVAEATGTLARARDRLGLDAVPLQRSTDNWNDERDARHQSRLSDIERRTRYKDELSNISLDRERHRLARMQKDDDEWNDTFNAMRDRIRHRSNAEFGRENDPRLEQGVAEVGQNFRRGNARRAALNAMSPEELKAHEEKRAEQQRKRDEARLERERQRNAAKKGVAEAPGAETLAHNQSTVASNEKAFDLEEGKPKEKEADYGPDYQDMVARVKKLAGLGPLKTVYDPQKRVYKNVPVAVQPAQKK